MLFSDQFESNIYALRFWYVEEVECITSSDAAEVF